MDHQNRLPYLQQSVIVMTLRIAAGLVHLIQMGLLIKIIPWVMLLMVIGYLLLKTRRVQNWVVRPFMQHMAT